MVFAEWANWMSWSCKFVFCVLYKIADWRVDRNVGRRVVFLWNKVLNRSPLECVRWSCKRWWSFISLSTPCTFFIHYSLEIWWLTSYWNLYRFQDVISHHFCKHSYIKKMQRVDSMVELLCSNIQSKTSLATPLSNVSFSHICNAQSMPT